MVMERTKKQQQQQQSQSSDTTQSKESVNNNQQVDKQSTQLSMHEKDQCDAMAANEMIMDPEVTKQLDVYSIYSNYDSNQTKSFGLFNGGLDIGMDLTQLSINFESKDNLTDRMKSPFPQPTQMSSLNHAHHHQQLVSASSSASSSINNMGSASGKNNNQVNGGANSLVNQQQQQMLNSSMHQAVDTQLKNEASLLNNESFSQLVQECINLQQDFRIPTCYTMSRPKQLQQSTIQQFPDRVLFYIFYNMANDRSQIDAVQELETRGWTYICEEMRWVKQKGNLFTRFNPETWEEEPLQ